MVRSPWEPYPERKRKLEERAKRPKNKQDRQKSSKKHRRRNPATDSSFSSSGSASGGRVPPANDRDGEKAEPVAEYHHHTHGGHRKDGHFRVRPENCWCLRESGCGDEDGCCVEDLPGVVVCPCFERVSVVNILESKLEMDTCGVCMEDGKLRSCCHRHYCKLCYEGTGNCPGCHLITVGANKGLLTQDNLQPDGVAGGAGKAPVVREGEECRSCLRQGFARKCCGEFYCSDCYFRGGHCPSCQFPAERRIKYQRVPQDPGFVPVLIGYAATVLVSLAVLACVSVAVANDNSAIMTIFGQKCYGFFPTCIEGPKCVAFEGDTADGLAPITEWNSCDDQSTVEKVYGGYCVFDEEVYIYSGGKWGFDFCADDFLSSPSGVFVFEDTFELWATQNISANAMASARWDHVINGELSKICGVGAGEKTMVFSGANYREVETLDVEMSYGGRLLFLIKMGPPVADASAVLCKPAYGGNVYIYYSLDSGDTWETLTILETFSYRKEDFTEELKEAGKTDEDIYTELRTLYNAIAIPNAAAAAFKDASKTAPPSVSPGAATAASATTEPTPSGEAAAATTTDGTAVVAVTPAEGAAPAAAEGNNGEEAATPPAAAE